jgi:hypothetical protein
MENIILCNTAAQINQTINETYCRLVNNCVSPLNQSSNSNSGFLIKNGNQQSGLFVGNTFNTFYSNVLNFDKCNTDLCIKTYDNKSFYLTGSSSFYHFDLKGNIGLGKSINSNYNGIQSYVSNPSIQLCESNPSLNASLKFFKSTNETFNLSQNSKTGTYLSGYKDFTLQTFDKCSLNISGCYFGFNGTANANYNFLLNGSSIQVGKAIFCTGITSCWLNCFCNSDNANILFDVGSKAIFRNTTTFSGDINLTGNLYSCKCLSGITGFLKTISGNGCSDYTSGIFKNLCVSGGSCANFNVPVKFTSDVSISNISSDEVYSTYISGSNLKITGGYFCYYGGGLDIKPTGNFTHYICGSCTVICSTGVNSNIILSGCTRANNLYIDCLCTSQTSVTNCIKGNLNIGSSLCASSIYSNAIVSGDSGYFNQTVTVGGITKVNDTLCVNQICSISTSNINCFRNDLKIDGNINANNVAKAWGVYSLKCGVPTILTGYNVCNYMTIPITGMRVANSIGGYSGTGANNDGWNYPFVFYGIKLCNTIKWPYTLDMKFSPVGVFDNCAYGISCTNTGMKTFGCYAVGYTPYGTFASTLSLPFIASMVNCAGKNTAGNYSKDDFAKPVVGSSYNEVIFNLSPFCIATNYTYYCVASNTTLNGTGSFVIYSY